jgi:hypothetical protein
VDDLIEVDLDMGVLSALLVLFLLTLDETQISALLSAT